MTEECSDKRNSRGKPFGPGNRGKPGRAKGTRNVKTIVQAFAEEKHSFIEDGKRVSLSSAELLIKALLAKSMEGDVVASKAVKKLRTRFAPTNENVGFLLVPGVMPEEMFEKLVEHHNSKVVQPDPPEGLY